MAGTHTQCPRTCASSASCEKRFHHAECDIRAQHAPEPGGRVSRHPEAEESGWLYWMSHCTCTAAHRHSGCTLHLDADVQLHTSCPGPRPSSAHAPKRKKERNHTQSPERTLYQLLPRCCLGSQPTATAARPQRVWGPGPLSSVQGPSSRVEGLGSTVVQGPGSRVQGPGSRVQSLGSRCLQGPGSGVEGR
eukprot:3763852-Rhodomonas_salina.1